MLSLHFIKFFLSTQCSHGYYLVYGKETHPWVETRLDDVTPRPFLEFKYMFGPLSVLFTRLSAPPLDVVGKPPPPHTIPGPTRSPPISVLFYLRSPCTPSCGRRSEFLRTCTSSPLLCLSCASIVSWALRQW